MTDPFEHFDGAYVLGALAPAERDLFEDHLLTCTACAARVAELADLPLQMAVLDADEVAAVDGAAAGAADPLPDTLLPALLREAARRRRRARWSVTALGSVAAALIAVLLAVTLPSSTGTKVAGAGPARPMRAVIAGAPVTASVRLVARKWGTEVDVQCRYTEASSHARVPYLLAVYDASGRAQVIGRWKLGPGDDEWFSGATDLSTTQISRVAIQLPDHTTVLALDT